MKLNGDTKYDFAFHIRRLFHLFGYTTQPLSIKRMMIYPTTMKTTLLLLFTCAVCTAGAQPLRDFKTKNESNITERTQMLDLLRIDTKNQIEQDVVFVVNHFKVLGSYAWMEGIVQRKDGKALRLPDEVMDCCHIEAFFKKVKGSWILKDRRAFSTDVWYMCLLDQYPEASPMIFPAAARESLYCDKR